MQVLEEIGNFPVIIRPAFTLGGTGGGIAYNMEEYKDIMEQGLAASVTNQVPPFLNTDHYKHHALMRHRAAVQTGAVIKRSMVVSWPVRDMHAVKGGGHRAGLGCPFDSLGPSSSPCFLR